MTERIVVTGADGFVGRALLPYLKARGHEVRGLARRDTPLGATGIGDLAEFTDWSRVFARVTVIIHLAARAHVITETEPDPDAEFTRINVDTTRRLALGARACGVRRLVFLSSIGVNGTMTGLEPFREGDPPRPAEAYARSKWAAEQTLLAVCGDELELVRIRPPLIIGAGAKGNLERLMRWVNSGLPLPFGSIRNSRSFAVLSDLCALLDLCASERRAAGQLFLAAHPQPLSTPDLIRAMAEGLGRCARLPAVPLAVLRALGRVAGSEALARLSGSLVVDSRRAREELGWSCSTDLREAVREMARAYGDASRSAPAASET
ncbi:MAG TPA: NAD-dependent epimerase/dehydratase family protein [Steroidobacteraceae bacterium]|nr:NAD-dependent epimerase/dehydratase family protein [Steroidobacteraceae bacterium]